MRSHNVLMFLVLFQVVFHARKTQAMSTATCMEHCAKGGYVDRIKLENCLDEIEHHDYYNRVMVNKKSLKDYYAGFMLRKKRSFEHQLGLF